MMIWTLDVKFAKTIIIFSDLRIMEKRKTKPKWFTKNNETLQNTSALPK